MTRDSETNFLKNSGLEFKMIDSGRSIAGYSDKKSGDHNEVLLKQAKKSFLTSQNLPKIEKKLEVLSTML